MTFSIGEPAGALRVLHGLTGRARAHAAVALTPRPAL